MVTRAAGSADRVNAYCQAPHWHGGVQVAPGWHVHVDPHLHAGPQAQVAPLLSVATPGAFEFESILITEESI